MGRDHTGHVIRKGNTVAWALHTSPRDYCEVLWPKSAHLHKPPYPSYYTGGLVVLRRRRRGVA